MDPNESSFDSPYRPFAVQLFNLIGNLLRRVGFDLFLSGDKAIRKAIAAKGLQDLGGDDFREPLQLLAEDMQASIKPTPFGRAALQQILNRHVENRLLLEAAWRRHPEVLKRPLNRPLYVIGMPRTGTTLLYNLLCQDPLARPLMVWESMEPALPEKEERTGNQKARQARVKSGIDLVNSLAPYLKRVHELSPDAPEECGWLTCNSFASPMFFLLGRLPRYSEWLDQLPVERWRVVYEYYVRQLQLLQGDERQRHWVLKSPAHQATLLPLMQAIPNAHVVQTHRDPAQVIASTCSLFCTLRGIFTDDLRPRQVGPEIAQRMRLALDRARLAEQAFPERMTNVLFDDLVRDPIGTVRRIYQRFGYEYSTEMEQRMQQWLTDNPQGKHGQHKYSLEQFGLTATDIQQQFREYRPQNFAA